MYRKNVASQFVYFSMVNATTGAAITGATPTARRAIDGGAQGSATGSVAEDGNGQYHLSASQADMNGNDIGFLFTSAGAIPVSISITTTAADPTDGVRFGLTALPNAAAQAAGGLYTRGMGAGQINQDANGRIDTNAVAVGGNAPETGAVVASLVAAAVPDDTDIVADAAAAILAELPSIASAVAAAVPDDASIQNDVLTILIDNSSIIVNTLFGAISEGTTTYIEAFRGMTGALCSTTSGFDTSNPKTFSLDGSKTRLEGVNCDGQGNRPIVNRDLS